MTHDNTTQSKATERMTPELFAALGVGSVAYVKAVKTDDHVNYAIHGADGRQLAVAPNRDAAFALIIQNDMEGVSLH